MSTNVRRTFGGVCRLVDQDAHDADRHACVLPVADCPLAEWVLGLFVVGTDGKAGSTEVVRLSPRELGAGKTTLVLVVGLLGALVASHGLFKGML
jgi:hypothetical protein